MCLDATKETQDETGRVSTHAKFSSLVHQKLMCFFISDVATPRSTTDAGRSTILHRLRRVEAQLISQTPSSLPSDDFPDIGPSLDGRVDSIVSLEAAVGQVRKKKLRDISHATTISSAISIPPEQARKWIDSE